MQTAKRKRLEANGWKVGTSEEFLSLSKEESEFIRLKLIFARCLKTKRIHKNYSQITLAKRIQSSQSRVAKMEQGDPSVSLDLLVRSLLALGTSRRELAQALISGNF